MVVLTEAIFPNGKTGCDVSRPYLIDTDLANSDASRDTCKKRFPEPIWLYIYLISSFLICYTSVIQVEMKRRCSGNR